MATQVIYSDAALTTLWTGALEIAQKTDNSIAPADVKLFLGVADPAIKIQATSNPGVDQIMLNVVDADAGNGNPVQAITLATTQLGLDSAVAGDPLNAGTTIVGGAGGAFEFWARIEDLTDTVGSYADLSIQTNDCDLLPV